MSRCMVLAKYREEKEHMTENPKEEQGQQERTWMEEFEIASNQLVDNIKNLVQEGNVRRIIIRDPNDRILMEIPLTTGVAVGSVMTVFAPIFVAVGAMAALVSLVKIEVVRVESTNEEPSAPQQDHQ